MRWIFVRNAVIAVNAVKVNISAHFTAFLTKIHRISYKNSPHQLLWQNNVRIAAKAVNAVKKTVHHISPHFLQKFTAFLTKIHRINFCGKIMQELRRKWWMWWKKIIHHISPLFLQKFTAKFTAFLTKIHHIWFPNFTQSDLNSQENAKLLVTVGAVD